MSANRAAAVSPAASKNLRALLGSAVLAPGDAGYDEARQLHNGRVDLRPALIVRCTNVKEVAATVAFAKSEGLPLSVRSGGHGVHGYALCEGGITLDMTQMRSIHVDPVKRIARAGAGATWGDFDPVTQEYGLATTGGVARPTGLAGLTLGGGHGYLMRKHGLTCDNLLSAELVDAEGRVLRVSAKENADLFWALRGGGGNFGVVTELEYQLHPVGQVFGGLLIHHLADARDFLRRYRDLVANAPDELGTLAAIATLPDGTRASAVLALWSGSVEEGEKLLKPLRTFKQPLVDQLRPTRYADIQGIAENFNPRGMRNYWKSSFLRELPDSTLDALIDLFPSVPSSHTHFIIECLGGAVRRQGSAETSVSHREAPFNFLACGMWSNPADDERCIKWANEGWSRVQPSAFEGGYINYLGTEGEEGRARIEASYGPNYRRLAAIKRKYDPTNFFRLNLNILPEAGA